MPRPSYGAARDSDVYVARDQDWHDFAEKEHSLANNDGNGGPNNVEYGEYEYDEDYYYYEEQADDSVAAVPVSDVAHSVYYDDMALTNVWLAALHDYKFDHPSQFAPQREAPRSAVVKCRLAPLWYGPEPSSNSTKTSAAVDAVSSASAGATRNLPASSSNPKSKANKKRQKREREKASALAVENETRAKRARIELEREEGVKDGDGHLVAPSSPKWAPGSPSAGSEPGADPRGDDADQQNARHRQSLLPADIPSPPPLVPADADDDDGAVAEAALESDEELLQAALWAWWNAGYQQGLLVGRLGLERRGRNEREGGTG